MTDRLLAPHYRAVTIAILLVVSLTAFDALSVYAALPDIGADLGHVSVLPWVMTIFLLSSSISLIAVGPLIDGVGVRTVARWSMVVLAVSTVGCAIAPSMWLLVAARFVQGLGGGAANAVAVASVGFTYPEPLRARAFAAESTTWALVGFGGPPVVAVLVATVGWRGVFAVNLPLIAIAALFGWSRLPPPETARARTRLDRRGIAIVAAFTTTLLVAASQLNWTGLLWLVATVAMIALYVAHARRSPDPVVTRSSLTAAPFGDLHLLVFLTLAGGLGVESFLPVFVRGALHRAQSTAAFVVVFLTVGWTAGAIAVSRLLDRITAPTAILVSNAVLVPSIAATGWAVVHTDSLALIGGAYVLVGICIGVLTTAAITHLQACSEVTSLGRLSTTHQYVRTIGISAGISVAGAVVLTVVAQRTGDIESIRALLSGKDVAVDRAAAGAIRSGYGWAHATATALAAAALVPSIRLARRGAPVPQASVTQPA